jgi:phytoene dehydrogenase-like protein
MPNVVRTAFARLDALDLLPAFSEVDPQCEYSFASGATLTAHRDIERTAASAAALSAGEASGVHSFYKEAAALYRFAGEPYLESPFEGLGRFLAHSALQGPAALIGRRCSLQFCGRWRPPVSIR